MSLLSLVFVVHVCHADVNTVNLFWKPLDLFFFPSFSSFSSMFPFSCLCKWCAWALLVESVSSVLFQVSMVEKRLCCSGPVAQVLSVWCPPGSMFFIHVYNPSIFFHPFILLSILTFSYFHLSVRPGRRIHPLLLFLRFLPFLSS